MNNNFVAQTPRRTFVGSLLQLCASHPTSRLLHTTLRVRSRKLRSDAVPTCQVLVVDVDSRNRGIIANIFAEGAFAVTQADTVDEAMRLAEYVHPDVVILDMVRPRSGGKALAGQIKARWPDIAIVAMSATPDSLPSLADGDFNAALAKPFEFGELVEIVRGLYPAGWTTA